MKKSLSLLYTALFSFAFVLLSCNKDSDASCEERARGAQWVSNRVVVNGMDISNNGEILLTLTSGGNGQIIIPSVSGSAQNYDIESWSISSGCDEFQFTDEDGSTGEFDIETLTNDAFTITGRLYQTNNVRIEFER